VHGGGARRCGARFPAVALPTAHSGFHPCNQGFQCIVLHLDDPAEVRRRGHEVDNWLGRQSRHRAATDVFHRSHMCGRADWSSAMSAAAVSAQAGSDSTTTMRSDPEAVPQVPTGAAPASATVLALVVSGWSCRSWASWSGR